MSDKSGPSGPHGLTPTDMLLAQGALIYRSSLQLASVIDRESGPAHQAATLEFVYGFVFVMLQHIGRALDQRRWPDVERDRVLGIVCRGLIKEALARAWPADSPHDFDTRLREHLQLFDDRAHSYVKFPIFPREGQRPAGTLVWELPKQAGKAANLEVDAATALTLPMAVMAAMLELKPPAFADMLAGALRR